MCQNILKRNNFLLFFFVFSSFLSCSSPKEGKGKRDAEIEVLIKKMSLKEKVGQMTQVTLDLICEGEIYAVPNPPKIDPKKLHKAVVEYGVGSILNCAGEAIEREKWLEIIGTIQKKATETKNKIPVLYGIDAIHGVNYTVGATMLPQQINLAATWNLNLAKKTGEITAYETRASGIPWNFSPVLDLGMDPRWPRFWETFGEDVHLVQSMGKAIIEGYQGANVGGENNVASCMKHFLGYSASRTGKDRVPAWIPERMMREYFLPSFKSAIDAGAKTLMVCSGEMNGIPVHTDKKILNDLLRGELGFQGLVVTDWEDIRYLTNRHFTQETYADAVYATIDAGVDMSMVPTSLDFADTLYALVQSGRISEERINESVRRILTLKKELGLFKNPYPAKKEQHEKFADANAKKESLTTALESMTLLKNANGILPLKKRKKVLVVGPAGHTMKALNGGWTETWQGLKDDRVESEDNTIFEAVQKIVGKANARFVKGTAFYKAEKGQSFSKDVAWADVVIACLGEDSYTEKMGDLTDLNLPEPQINVVTEVHKKGKPIVTVLIEGRPRIIRKIEPLSKAILMAYLPGNFGGDAVAMTLFGENNPSGKLPFTYPRYANSLENYYHKKTESLEVMQGSPEIHSKTSFDPQYEFGHGLSYTSFEYSNLELKKESVTQNDMVQAFVTVKNMGKRKGKEAILCFVSDVYASITPPAKRLRWFDKIELEPKEEKRVEIQIPVSELSFIGKDNKPVLEKGEFVLSVGNHKKSFHLK